MGSMANIPAQSQSLVFLSLELETAVVALLTTVDLRSIDSVCRLCPGAGPPVVSAPPLMSFSGLTRWLIVFLVADQQSHFINC